MPFRFSAVALESMDKADLMIEDRRNNPVNRRTTKFRLNQQNILAYTYPFIPGFAETGINRLPFPDLVDQAIINAKAEGVERFGRDFEVSSNAVAKVAGDIFEEVEAAIHWTTAAIWNAYMTGASWSRVAPAGFLKPPTTPHPSKRIAVLSLPRRFDWVRLLEPGAAAQIALVRETLGKRGLTMPTSTPDLLVVNLPPAISAPPFLEALPNIGLTAQATLDNAYQLLEGHVPADGFLLGVAFKKSLRSDRLYQPLYEANVMQILLEGKLGAPRVEFEVHTLDSFGTKAEETYSAASLGLVASGSAEPHRAIRELYEPRHAEQLARRFLDFLADRLAD